MIARLRSKEFFTFPLRVVGSAVMCVYDVGIMKRGNC